MTWLLTRLLQEARADAAWPADAQVIDGYVELTGSAPRRTLASAKPGVNDRGRPPCGAANR